MDPTSIGGLAPGKRISNHVVPGTKATPFSKLPRIERLRANDALEDPPEEDDGMDEDEEDESKATTPEEKEKMRMRGRGKTLKRFLRKKKKNVIDPATVSFPSFPWLSIARADPRSPSVRSFSPGRHQGEAEGREGEEGTSEEPQGWRRRDRCSFEVRAKARVVLTLSAIFHDLSSSLALRFPSLLFSKDANERARAKPTDPRWVLSFCFPPTAVMLRERRNTYIGLDLLEREKEGPKRKKEAKRYERKEGDFTVPKRERETAEAKANEEKG